MATFRFEIYQFNTQTRILSGLGEPVELRQQLAELLTLFLNRSGQVITKHQLCQALWPETQVQPHSLALLISELRKTLDTAHEIYQLEHEVHASQRTADQIQVIKTARRQSQGDQSTKI